MSQHMDEWADRMFGVASNGNAVDEGDEDFYAPTDAVETGAPLSDSLESASGESKIIVPIPSHPTPVQIKAENQQRAELLRAKLLAQRHNTPKKATPQPKTPATEVELNPRPSATASKDTPPATLPTIAPEKGAGEGNWDDDLLGALLDQGQAAAAAAATARRTALGDVASAVPQTNGHAEHPQKETAVVSQVVLGPDHMAPPSVHPASLSHTYYSDLSAWLEITEYHDIEYRTSKLRTYKERKALEHEAARIAERLEKLRQEEQETIKSLRATPARSAPTTAPPALPSTLPAESHAESLGNGNKRVRSPGPEPAGKFAKRDDVEAGYRIRGMNHSPEARPGGIRRPHSPSPSSYDRRVSYTDGRRRSSDMYAPSRDPSLERRLSNYRTDVDAPPSGSYWFRTYDAYDGGRQPAPPARRPQPPLHKGNAASDGRRGRQPFPRPP